MSKSCATAVKKRRRDPVKEAVWRDRLMRFDAAGLTVAAFCQGEGITPASFYHWRAEVRRRDAEATGVFVELVPAVEPVAAAEPAVEAAETPVGVAAAVVPRPSGSDAGSGGPGRASMDPGGVEALTAGPGVPLELWVGCGWRLLIRPGCGRGLLRRAVAALAPLRDDASGAGGTGPPPVMAVVGRRRPPGVSGSPAVGRPELGGLPC
jgi:hypothetical protein